MVIFRCKKTCEISTENYVLCSFKSKKDPVFRICAIRMDLRVKSYYNLYIYQSTEIQSNLCSIILIFWNMIYEELSVELIEHSFDIISWCNNKKKLLGKINESTLLFGKSKIDSIVVLIYWFNWLNKALPGKKTSCVNK